MVYFIYLLKEPAFSFVDFCYGLLCFFFIYFCPKAACILVLMVMFLHCWRISGICVVLELVGSWVELGFSVGVEAFG